MSKALDDLTAQVARTTDIEKSAVQLIDGIAAQLQALTATNNDPQLAALASQLQTGADQLAAAIVANTPAAPAPAPTPAPAPVGGSTPTG